MASTTQFNNGGSAMPAANPSGVTSGSAPGSETEGAGATLQAEAQGDAHPQPQQGGAGAQSAGRKGMEADARGQFVQSQHGHHNNGVSSASPRVTTGTDDATFKHESGD